MPKGGHRGGLFPLSGARVGPNFAHRKPGLYFLNRQHIFTPRWGLRRLRENNAVLPDGSAKSFAEDVTAAWPAPPSKRHDRLYAKNETRYLIPAMRAADCKHREFLLNQLEPSHRRSFSGIGLPNIPSMDSQMYVSLVRATGGAFVRLARHQDQSVSTTFGMPALGCGAGEEDDSRLAFEATSGSTRWREGGEFDEVQHYQNEGIETIMRETDVEVYEMLKSTTLQRGRIERLYKVIQECDLYRGGVRSRMKSRFPLPYVDENANLVGYLDMQTCCFSRSDHRINSRRHPGWLQRQFDCRRNQDKHKMRLRILKQEHSRRLLRQAFNIVNPSANNETQ